ncbi:MAG: hypothetical protein LRY26_00200 [Bacilli bacterium]|nr:hypothetical protein [Bacilli bacterium]
MKKELFLAILEERINNENLVDFNQIKSKLLEDEYKLKTLIEMEQSGGED